MNDSDRRVTYLEANRYALWLENQQLRTLLDRLRKWDHMDTAADGSYWRSEIDKALGTTEHASEGTA